MGDRKPQLLRTDRGSEFKNRYIAAFLKKHGIHHIFSMNETKSNFAERAIQNLQNRLSRVFMYKQSYSFLEELPNITQSINDTPSRSLGNKAPSAVNKTNADKVRFSAYLVRTKTNINPKKKTLKPETYKKKSIKRQPGQSYLFKINDKVRITQGKSKFTREYSQKWTGEVFIVSHKFMRGGIPIYKLKDFSNEPVSGSFYGQELQKLSNTEIWKVDKVLKKRKTPSGKKELFVSWYQWPSKFNSWIKESDLLEVS